MKFLGDLLDGRREHAARAAPRRPKIHQHRPVRLHNFGFPIRITNLSDKLTHFYLLKSYNCLLKIYHYTVSTSGFSARALYQTHPFAGTRRGRGDKGTRGQGDKETRRQGDKETRRERFLSFLSPCPLVPLSPCPPLPLHLLAPTIWR